MLTNEEIKSAVEAAFRPLRTVAEIWDYETKLRFKVFNDNDEGIIENPNTPLRFLREKRELFQLISSVRTAIENKGFSLDTWDPN